VTGLLGDLADAVGPAWVLDAGPEATLGYGVDWSGRYRGEPRAVVLPGSAAEVAAVVEACRRHGAALVPQGGNTGLVGGSVPVDGEVVLNLRRLDRVAAVDGAAGQVTAEAGVTLAAVQAAAAAAGWAYGVDIASRSQATVGGTVGTNAAGLRALRHGDTRAQVVGVEAVLGDGSVVSHLGGLVRDNTGYHLPSLLCGSEGTLGVVTAARLRLVPPAAGRAAALVAFGAVGAALGAAGELRGGLPSVDAVELVLGAGVELVCRVRSLPPPFPSSYPAYLVVEAAGPAAASPVGDLEAVVASLAGVAASVVAGEPEERARLWRYREEHSAAVNTLGPPHKFDLAFPAAALAAFVAEAPGVVARVAAGAACWMWGHVADGNVHLNVTGVEPGDPAVDEAVLGLAAGLGGSISAEHGIGRAKRRWLALNRSEAEIRAFRALKAALDPAGILNPNVLLPGPQGPGPLVGGDSGPSDLVGEAGPGEDRLRR
jgi:FAD/FMN-containing dehydrogenase